MSYREYVPTCVETLFGKPPTKFKARAIIPESKTFNLETLGGGHLPNERCKCCACENYDSPKRIQNVQEDFPRNDNQYKCIIDCPDCGKPVKKKKQNVRYNEDPTEARQFKNRTQSRRAAKYECYCTPLRCNDLEEYNSPEERTRPKHKTNKKKNYYSEPSRSTGTPDQSGCERFCSVCKLWIRSNSNEKRDQYSSKNYEDRELVEDPKTKGKVQPKEYRFVVKSCKFCGSRRNGPSEFDKNGDEFCQSINNISQSQDICDLGRKIEECSRSEDFFTIKELNEQLVRPNEKERDSCEEMYDMFAAEMTAREGFPEKPKGGELIKPNSQENFQTALSNKEPSSNPDFKKAHSTSEISNIEKEYENSDRTLEEHKQKLMNELKDNQSGKSPTNTNFRSCNCEYAHRDWKVEMQQKKDPDLIEIRLLKQKCIEAMAQLELFKREIAESKQGKCRCDMEFTMCVIEDCKDRCAQLEKQVLYLQRCINSYTRSVQIQPIHGERNTGPRQAIEKRRPQEDKKKSVPIRDYSSSRKRDQSREVIKTSVKVVSKQRSTCPPDRPRNFGCQHIRCFPADQIQFIPSFKACPDYKKMTNKR